MEGEINDIKVILSLMLNARGRELSSAERLVWETTIKRLGMIIHPRDSWPYAATRYDTETQQPIVEKKK